MRVETCSIGFRTLKHDGFQGRLFHFDCLLQAQGQSTRLEKRCQGGDRCICAFVVAARNEAMLADVATVNVTSVG